MPSFFNATCPIPKSVIERPNSEYPITGNIKFQTILIYISFASAVYTTIVCCYLAFIHLINYVRAREQRQIVRLAFYPLFFAVFSAACVYNYPDSIYLEPARDLIEPISLAALFLLFLEYSEPDHHRRESYFRGLECRAPKGGRFSREKGFAIVPGGSLRWFQGKWVALFSYFIADTTMKIVQLITQAAGRYCASSFSPAFAHIWVTFISYIALPVGILAVIQFYVRMKNEPQVARNKPTRKIWAFKGVLLLNFVQEIIFTILVSAKVFKGTKTVTLEDFQIGIPTTLLAVEQVVASTLFVWAFPVKPYKDLEKQSQEKKINPIYALVNACNILDLVYASVYAIRLVGKGVGPYGNGSWKRNGGYDKLNDAVTDVQMKRATTFRPHNLSSSDAASELAPFTHGAVQQIDEESTGYEPMRRSKYPQYPAPAGSPHGRHEATTQNAYGPPSYRTEYGESSMYDDPYNVQMPHDPVADSRAPAHHTQDRLLPRSRSPGTGDIS